jgi:hypothetical protein
MIGNLETVIARIQNITTSLPSLSIWDSTAPIASLLASVSKMKSREKSGWVRIGALVRRCFKNSNASWHSSVHIKALPFLEVIKNWPTPTSVTELRSFLGLCGYYRRYIKDFSAKAKCLHRLTEKGRASTIKIVLEMLHEIDNG